MLTLTEIKNISYMLRKYHKIANDPDENNNIIIKNNKIGLCFNGKYITIREINLNDLIQEFSKIRYTSNIFESYDSKFSPLEADRNKNKWIWKENYNHINIPRFMPVILFSIFLIDKIPSIPEFCRIYMEAYTEEIPELEQTEERFKLYKHKIPNDRTQLGKIKYYNQQRPGMKNKVLRFKSQYNKYINGLPINEFTSEQLCFRIHKVYGSVIRDIYTPLIFNSKGLDAYYSWLDDIDGIDCILNNVPIFSFTNTKSAEEFRLKKIKYRHANLVNWGINFKADLQLSLKNKTISLPDEQAIQKVLHVLNKSRVFQDKIINIIY